MFWVIAAIEDGNPPDGCVPQSPFAVKGDPRISPARAQ
jgi:hypothetical protein